MNIFKNNEWALILGGSSGFGLASAKKLASLGMNLFIVHRDRKGAMSKINEEFDKIRSFGSDIKSFNVNALSTEGRESVISAISDYIADGKIKLVLHSIALGNLKLIAPLKNKQSDTIDRLSQHLNISKEKLQNQIDALFEGGANDLAELASAPNYSNDSFIEEEDMAQTIYNMGTNLLSWVQDLFQKGVFADDARILGLTSEGNEIAWKGYAAVSAAKTALESVSRSIAREFGAYGIRSNILQPGITDTPALRLIPGNQHMKAQAIRRNPLERLTTPSDVANVVALMCMEESAWINGAIIRVDGGEHISG